MNEQAFHNYYKNIKQMKIEKKTNSTETKLTRQEYITNPFFASPVSVTSMHQKDIVSDI